MSELLLAGYFEKTPPWQRGGVFCCAYLSGDGLDESGPVSTLVLTTHGIIKKAGKTPRVDLDKAEQIRKVYFDQKIN